MKRKLTQSQAEAIRKEFTSTCVSISELGRKFKISHGSIARIIRGECYKE